MEVVTGDLPDVPVEGTLGRYCFDRDDRSHRMVGVVDDVLIRMEMHRWLEDSRGYAATCAERAGSGIDLIGVNAFHQWYVHNRGLESLYRTALHEIGHTLGIGGWMVQYLDGYPHFPGPLAVAAFDAAGGAAYAGAKVPLQPLGMPGPFVHWRQSVIPGDVMSPYGDSLLTAITLQALADMGHGVDLTKADPYALPPWTQADVGRGAADSARASWPDGALACKVVEGPVTVVDGNGKIVRVIRP